MRFRLPLNFLLLAILVSCNLKDDTLSKDDLIIQNVRQQPVKAKVEKLKRGTFHFEILSNGTATASNQVDIKFPVNAEIKLIKVKNGEDVTQGELLATMSDVDFKLRVARAKGSLDKALVELDDRLIDFGYRLKDSLIVPREIMRMARIKSNYNSASYDFADARNALIRTQIRAPIAGKIANLDATLYNSSDIYSKFCTLMDVSRLKIQFRILESEYNFIQKGSEIVVSPFGQNVALNGIVSEINPVVDQNGMIKVVGLVNNFKGLLIHGMSVKVIVKKAIADKLYVPKQSVLQRNDRFIVFTFEDGRAKWNYVEVGHQNSKYIIINSGLATGEKVITSNNVALAHNTEVTIDDASSAPH